MRMCSDDRVRKTATKLAEVQVANTGPYREAHTRYLTSYRASAEPLEEIRQKQLHTTPVYLEGILKYLKLKCFWVETRHIYLAVISHLPALV